MIYCDDLNCQRHWGVPWRGVITEVMIPLLQRKGLRCDACFGFWEDANYATIDVNNSGSGVRRLLQEAGFELLDSEEGFIVLDMRYEKYVNDLQEGFEKIRDYKVDRVSWNNHRRELINAIRARYGDVFKGKEYDS